MSKQKKIKKKLDAFVNQLTIWEAREQLVLAYLQMERCQQVLRGEDVEPVSMMDNGLSSDLELFYLCKKKSEELSLQEKDKNAIKFRVVLDCDEAIKQLRSLGKAMQEFDGVLRYYLFQESLSAVDEMPKDIVADACNHAVNHMQPASEETVKSLDGVLKDIEKEIEKFPDFTKDLIREKPSKETLGAIRKYERECKPLPLAGDNVWFFRGMPICSEIKSTEFDYNNGWTIELTDGSVFRGYDGFYRTKEDLISRLKEYVYGEEKSETCKRSEPQAKFKVGDEVYTMLVNVVEKMKIVEVEDCKREGWHYVLSKGENRYSRSESDIFSTVEELLNHLKENINGEDK